ncbi:glycosyltransferase family 4 protein [Flavobacterium caseinilyticum]|uniref:Glycosyltransferase n=1 Tax=Flavobacterium caseinilyticum TaxID=2541732 RepID=A0A4R5B0H7_9FLAO|nr:glycosyltransferase family 4 protein [Flavobacterium caseinilyticum]TDD77014.1 glycosyltransferase [Flavobacterium caseinilyticum]
MLALVTNIPTPYRTAFFNTLQQELLKVGQSLHVVYCSKTETGRHWQFNPEENNYVFTFLKGWHPEFKGFYPHVNIGLLSHLTKLKPDWIMLAGSWNAPATITVILNKRKLNCPVIFWSEGHFDAQMRANKYIDFLRKTVLNKLDYFVVPNVKSKEYILHYNKSAIIDFLPNTIDESFFSLSKNDSKEQNRKLKKLPIDKTILILVSSLDKRKGVLDFYEAFKKSKKDTLYVVQIGTGEFYDTLKERLIADNLSEQYRLTGQLKANDVRAYLIAADVFVLPTKSDPNPLSPIEAAFLKKALLLSAKAGNAQDLIPNKENGWILNQITSADIIESINKIAETDKQRLEEMGEKSFQIVSDSFTRKKASEYLIVFLNKIKK